MTVRRGWRTACEFRDSANVGSESHRVGVNGHVQECHCEGNLMLGLLGHDHARRSLILCYRTPRATGPRTPCSISIRAQKLRNIASLSTNDVIERLAQSARLAGSSMQKPSQRPVVFQDTLAEIIHPVLSRKWHTLSSCGPRRWLLRPWIEAKVERVLENSAEVVYAEGRFGDPVCWNDGRQSQPIETM
ncbi:hypothetical protein BDW71DRAFT_175528 [Aspergillus fruticulosus]